MKKTTEVSELKNPKYKSTIEHASGIIFFNWGFNFKKLYLKTELPK